MKICSMVSRLVRVRRYAYMKFISLANDQLDAQIFNTLFIILYMFQAKSCSSSGGQIVLIQHLVSSLSVSDRPVHRLRKYKMHDQWNIKKWNLWSHFCNFLLQMCQNVIKCHQQPMYGRCVSIILIHIMLFFFCYKYVNWTRCTVIPWLTSDPVNEFFG
jgi:hypothetical protein